MQEKESEIIRNYIRVNVEISLNVFKMANHLAE